MAAVERTLLRSVAACLGEVKMAKWHVRMLCAAVLLAACASPAQPPLRRPVHDSWITDGVRPAGDLALSQRAEFAGTKLRICRILRNISAREVVVMAIPPTGDSYDQFYSFTFGPHGMPTVERTGSRHPMIIPPPPPRDADDESPFNVIQPGEALENCVESDLPRDVSAFTVLSKYGSNMNAAQVPPRLRQNRSLFLREQGRLLSNLCFVYVELHQISCENRSPFPS